MKEFTEQSAFFAISIVLVGYGIGIILERKFKNPLCNPLLISIILTILFLLAFGIEYKTFEVGAKPLSFLLTPATVCLAVPLYKQMELLKQNIRAILVGIFMGVLASLGSIFLMAKLFGLNRMEYLTLLPKSITTAIGMGVSEELGGVVALTVVSILMTGLLGNIIGKTVCRIFHIKHPVSKGLAFGTAAHAIGTARAMQLGEAEGAMSSLAIVIAGLLTVAGAGIFATFM